MLSGHAEVLELPDELKNGLPVRKRTLNAVLDEYIRLRERDNEQGKPARSTVYSG